MRILITGATGFVGRALVPALLRLGHQPVAWARSPGRARSLLGAGIDVAPASGGDDALRAELARCDAVVNLQGEPIIRRWTNARRAALVSSRVDATRRLVAACAAVSSRPRVLVSASAVGYYGDRGDEPLIETSAPGRDFLGTLGTEWEAAASGAAELGMRVVLLRTGIVLGREGGALASMRLPFSLGLGGPMGSGRQYMPWIHLHDLVGIITAAIADERYEGPLNAVGPEETTNRTFARALGHAVGRPAVVPVPALALRVLFGEASVALLSSQRVRPARLETLGFRFAYPTLERALEDVSSTGGVTIGAITTPPRADTPAGATYLHHHPPRFELRTTTVVDAPLEETFRFFSEAANLGLITPSAMAFQIEGPPPSIREGTALDYRIRVGPVPLKWRTRIVSWHPGRRFADVQERGPYYCWWHEHTFRAEGERTVMDDRVCYAPPVPGILGTLANRLVVAPMLGRIFAYRGDVIRLRFGGGA